MAGFYLTGIGTIPSQEEKEHFECDSNGKHLTLINDKVKDGRITKLKLMISNIEQNSEQD
ncbi:hypothetical protein ABG808_02825 [Streptococcus iniae]